MSKKVCKACFKKHGLLENGEKFLPSECGKCGEYAFCQDGRHKIKDMSKFFDNAQPVNERGKIFEYTRKGRIKYVG